MKDRPTELSESQRFTLGRQRIERCGVCKCIPRTEHRAQLSGSVFVTFCGSYYCEARAVSSLEELRDRVYATGLPDLARVLPRRGVDNRAMAREGSRVSVPGNRALQIPSFRSPGARGAKAVSDAINVLMESIVRDIMPDSAPAETLGAFERLTGRDDSGNTPASAPTQADPTDTNAKP